MYLVKTIPKNNNYELVFNDETERNQALHKVRLKFKKNSIQKYCRNNILSFVFDNLIHSQK